jgi:hypothetical protein
MPLKPYWATRVKADQSTTERTLRETARISNHDPARLYRDDGTLKNIPEMDEDTRAAIVSFEVEEIERDGRQWIALWAGPSDDSALPSINTRVARWYLMGEIARDCSQRINRREQCPSQPVRALRKKGASCSSCLIGWRPWIGGRPLSACPTTSSSANGCTEMPTLGGRSKKRPPACPRSQTDPLPGEVPSSKWRHRPRQCWSPSVRAGVTKLLKDGLLLQQS